MTAICRICQCNSEGEINVGEDKLIRACGCEGTQAHTHARCVEAWVRRRLESGCGLSAATLCEICGVRYRHRVIGAPMRNFLFGKEALKRWMHVAYVWFLGRRMAVEVGYLVGWIRRLGGRGRAAFSAALVAHYCAFLMLDLGLLVKEYKRWRAKNLRVVVCDRDWDGGGERDVVER